MKAIKLTAVFAAFVMFCVSAFPAICAAQTTDSLRITYIANYGALLEAGGKQVLIDGLFRQGVPGYARVPESTLQALENAEPPYDQIDVVLVSHPHADHFDAKSVAAQVRNNPSVILLSSEQVVSTVGTHVPEAAKDRLIEVTPAWKERETKTVAGIEIEVLRIRHGYYKNYSLHNLGHLIHLGGKKILHLGDAEMIDENFAPFDLPAEKIDVALLPYWFLNSDAGSKIVRELIRPQAIIAMHIEPAQARSISTEIAEAFPQAQTFTRPLQRRLFSP